MKYVGIVSYNMGNLHSVAKAISSLGVSVIFLKDPRDFDLVSVIILPGVGSFNIAMKELQRLNFVKPLKLWIKQKKPFIGICLGLQLLFDYSDEGNCEGLGVIKGSVVKFNVLNVHKIPHMGWNKLLINSTNDKYFTSLGENNWMYFVHNYYVTTQIPNLESSYIIYGKQKILASITCDNIFAIQFHPEKSGFKGLLLLNNFLKYHSCLS